MKPREPRRKVLIRARMRVVADWSDVCILNISSRGILLQSARPPNRGSYVEIGRGPILIVARVVWSEQHRFGVKTQDFLPVDALCAENPEANQEGIGPVLVERRAAPRRGAEADRSRTLGRTMEFACIGCLAAMGATAVYGAVHQALSKPLSSLSAALGP